MKENYNCPCCKSNHTEIIDTIQNDDLHDLYMRKFNISVRNLFKEDKTYLLKCLNCDLIFYFPQTGGDEAFYNKLQQYPWYYTSDKEEYRFAKQYLTPNESVLEIGSGSGTFAELIPKNPYLGLEFSQKAIELAAKKGIKVINESIEKHSNNHPNHYDAVVFFQVLEHVIDIHDFLKAAVYTLKPNGKLIISVPSEDFFLSSNVNDILNFPPHHSSRYVESFFYNIQSIFNIKLVKIKHQKIEKIHQPQYFKNIIYLKLLNIFGRKFKRIENQFSTMILEKVSYVLGKIISLFYTAKTKGGHTITVIYEKRSEE